MAIYAVIEKLRPNQGRNQDKTYVNVVTSPRTSSKTFAELILTAPWNDPGFKEFIVELTQLEFDTFNASNGLFHDGNSNLPKVQRNTSLDEFGSYADPESDASAWSEGVDLPDDRWIVELYDGDPGAAGVHVATIDLETNVTPGTVKVIHLKLFNSNGSASGTNAQDQKTEIAGNLMIFDFTSGVTTFNIPLTVGSGIAEFPSNHLYRHRGPSGEISFSANIFSRELFVSPN